MKSRTFRTPYEIGHNYTPRRHFYVSFASVQKHKCSFTSQFLLFPIKSSSMLFRGPLCVKLRSCGRLDKIKAGVCAPARFHPKENCIFLALLCSYPFARYHKTRIEKADWKQKHFQSAYLFVRQISFQLMPGLPQLKGRCTLPPFHKAHHLPTLPMRV